MFKLLFFKPVVVVKPLPKVDPWDWGGSKFGIFDLFFGIKKIIQSVFDHGKTKVDDCNDDCDSLFVIDSNTVVINGTAGDDDIRPGAGNQTIYGGDGNDKIAGGPGADQLSGGAGDDSVAGDQDNDIICGGTGNDLVLGNAGDDKVYGGSGDDRMFGGRDNDILNGGSGNDRMQGDIGNDVLTGCAGVDTFVFLPGDGQDVVKDFGSCGDQDLIDLSAMGTSFDTFAEVIAVTTFTTAGATINFGGGQTVLLEGVRSTDLSSADFIF